MINSYGISSKCIIHVRHFTIFDRAIIKPQTLSHIFCYFAGEFYKFHIYVVLILFVRLRYFKSQLCITPLRKYISLIINISKTYHHELILYITRPTAAQD